MARKGGAQAGTSRAAASALRRKRFIEALLADPAQNATAAAIAAGYSAKSAKQQASRLLTQADVRAALEKRREQLGQQYELDTDSVIRRLSEIVHFDPRRLFHADGTLKKPHELDPDIAQALHSIEVDEVLAGKGENRKVITRTAKVKWHDKNTAIGNAMKHLGLFAKHQEQMGRAAGKAAGEAVGRAVADAMNWDDIEARVAAKLKARLKRR